jgi:hypothetical protein
MTYSAMAGTQQLSPTEPKKRPAESPPPHRVTGILKCANHPKISGAIQRVVFVLMQGEPAVHPEHASPFHAESLARFIRNATWSLIVFNMVAFEMRDTGEGLMLACVPITEGCVERGVHPKTGEITYRWCGDDKRKVCVFSVNPADIGGGWFNSPVANLTRTTALYDEMHANYSMADHALSSPVVHLSFERSRLFGPRPMGDAVLGDVTENNADGTVHAMLVVQQAVRSDPSTGGMTDAQRADINAARATGAESFVQQVGPMNVLHGADGEPRQLGGTSLLYISPGFAPSSTNYRPSRNPDFLTSSLLEREIAAQMGLPLSWLTDTGRSKHNSVDSENDKEKLQVSIEILRQHLSDLFTFMRSMVPKCGEDGECGDVLFGLRWGREIAFNTIYVEKRARDEAPDAEIKRQKTEPAPDIELSDSTDTEDESDISESDSGGFDDAA